jgi:hypothetical protein
VVEWSDGGGKQRGVRTWMKSNDRIGAGRALGEDLK